MADRCSAVSGCVCVRAHPTGRDIPTDKENCKILPSSRLWTIVVQCVGVCAHPTGIAIPTDKENCKILPSRRIWTIVQLSPTENCRFSILIRRLPYNTFRKSNSRRGLSTVRGCVCVLIQLEEIFLQIRKTVKIYRVAYGRPLQCSEWMCVCSSDWKSYSYR